MKDSHSNKKLFLLTLNISTIWVPLIFLLGAIGYISVKYPGEIDSGFLILPFFIKLVPMLVVGVGIAGITLVWLVYSFITQKAERTVKNIFLGSVWALASAAYLAYWVWSVGGWL